MATMAELAEFPDPSLSPWREWTVEDLESLPDDGRRYELIDGILSVSPAPLPLHQRALRELLIVLHAGCPAEDEVFCAPLDWQPDARNSIQPDLLVVRRRDVGPRSIRRPLLLAVEILSPTTRRRDQSLKRRVYEEAGVVSYWMFDPEVPSLVVCELVEGRYVEAAKAIGGEEVHVELPYPVRLCPAELAEG